MERTSASQVGYESVESLTKAPSESQVNTVEAAVTEIAASPDEQSAVQEYPGCRDSRGRRHEWADVTRDQLA